MPKIGDMTKYGMLVEKPFEEGVELIPKYVHHLPDTAALRLNQFIYMNEALPWKTESWCTQSPAKGALGVWNGPRKLRTMKMVDEGVYPEFVLLETNFEADNTVGVVGPRVCILKDGSQFVAVNRHKFRRGGTIVEAMRQRHGSLDAKPKVSNGSSLAPEEYGSNELGLLLTNSACIHAETPDGKLRLALVRPELVIERELDYLPTIDPPFEWIPLADYMLLEMDDHGQAVIGRAIVAGYLPTPKRESVELALAKLPAIVAERTK